MATTGVGAGRTRSGGAADGECVIGVDVGTTGSRAVAFDLEGRVLHATSAEYPLNSPHPGWAEQEPERVLEATTACLRELMTWVAGERLHAAALGLSAILHSMIAVDADGNALSPSIIWADGRSVGEADEIRRETDALALYRRVGGPVHPMYLSAKIRWLRTHQPDVFGRAAAFVGIKEFILRRWTGLNVCDKSIASGTGLFNGASGQWDGEALSLAGITEDRLPPVVETSEPLDVPAGRLRALGLPEDCVFVAGAGDGVLQTIGTGTLAPHQMVAMVATSGAMRTVSDTFLTDPKARTWCYYLAAGKWVAGAAINNAGVVYAWLRDQLAHGRQELEVTELNEWAEQVPAGANGLVFLPYLAGERSPGWNANARGLLFGLSLAHDYRHLARATLEGVGYRMRTIYEPMVELAGSPRELRAAGGFIRSELWLQIVADVLGRPLQLVDSPEASALGAAQLAMLGAGVVDELEDFAPMVRPTGTVEPDATRTALYDRLFAIYQRLYAAAQEPFAEIAALQAELARSQGGDGGGR